MHSHQRQYILYYINHQSINPLTSINHLTSINQTIGINENMIQHLKIDKINMYKSLIKRKTKYYINKMQEQLSELYKLDPKKLWSQILNHNTKENNIFSLRYCNSYLKSIYEFPNVMDTIPIVPTKDAIFSLDDIEFGVKRLGNGKDKDIEGYQAEFF
jgi:hypothetical protein